MLEPRLEHLGGPAGPRERRFDLGVRHAVSLAQVGRAVRGRAADADAARVDPLDVDRRQRRLERPRDLRGDRDAAARDADDDRLGRLQLGHRLGQGSAGGRAVAVDGRDPGN